MYVEIDNAELKDGELIKLNGNTEIIENVLSLRITKNNKYIAISTPERRAFNAILVDMTKFNITCFNGNSNKNW